MWQQQSIECWPKESTQRQNATSNKRFYLPLMLSLLLRNKVFSIVSGLSLLIYFSSVYETFYRRTNFKFEGENIHWETTCAFSMQYLIRISLPLLRKNYSYSSYFCDKNALLRYILTRIKGNYVLIPNVDTSLDIPFSSLHWCITLVPQVGHLFLCKFM